jgi:hypothetical protein
MLERVKPESAFGRSHVTAFLFKNAPWISLAAISLIYTVIILIPFYSQGIYHMSDYEMLMSPTVEANTLPLQCTCGLWIWGGLPLLLLCAAELRVTWSRTSMLIRLIKLFLLIYVVTATGFSYLDGRALFSWALSLDLAHP